MGNKTMENLNQKIFDLWTDSEIGESELITTVFGTLKFDVSEFMTNIIKKRYTKLPRPDYVVGGFT